MEQLRRQLGEIHQANNLVAYQQKTQVLLQALKLGTVTLDSLQVTPDGWNLVEFKIEPEERVEDATADAAGE